MLSALLIVVSNAQKITILSGNLSAIKSGTSIKIDYTYSDALKVGKLSESDYVKDKMEKAEKDAPGGGEKWKQAWLEDRTRHFEPKFAQLFSEYLAEKGVTASESKGNFRLEVITIFIEPGFNVGISSRPALVDFEFVLYDSDNNEISRISLLKSPGYSPMGADFDTGVRIGESYAKAGKELAKFFIKNAKL